jgi:hypothetical protein
MRSKPPRALRETRLETVTFLPHLLRAGIVETGCHPGGFTKAATILSDRSFVMRHVTALTAALCIAVAAVATVSPAEAAGYYVIRWDNTGVCQIWNEELTFKPLSWPSTYKVVSKPVPTFAAAASIQEKMRLQRSCTL